MAPHRPPASTGSVFLRGERGFLGGRGTLRGLGVGGWARAGGAAGGGAGGATAQPRAVICR